MGIYNVAKDGLHETHLIWLVQQVRQSISGTPANETLLNNNTDQPHYPWLQLAKRVGMQGYHCQLKWNRGANL